MINTHTWLPKKDKDPQWSPVAEVKDMDPYPLFVTRDDGFVGLPRCHGTKLAKQHTIKLVDDMINGEFMSLNTVFNGTLANTSDRPQQRAVDAILKAWRTAPNYTGIVAAHTGFGKTVVAIAAAVVRHRKTLLLVHTDILFQQWIDRIKQWAPAAIVGVYRGSECRVDKCDFVVATLQTIYSKRNVIPDDLTKSIGTVIVDEVHHVAARTFCTALQLFPARARLGLSATPRRSDGLTHVLHMLLGQVVFKTEYRPAQVVVEQREFQWSENLKPIPNTKSDHMKRLLIMKRLAANRRRNMDIVRTVIALHKAGRHVLVLSKLVHHLTTLYNLLPDNVSKGLLVGKTKKSDRQKILTDCKVILSTDRLAKEGMDVASLDTLVLCMPMHGVQYYGRITRTDRSVVRPNHPLIVDYDDVGFDEVSVKYANQAYRTYNFKVEKKSCAL